MDTFNNKIENFDSLEVGNWIMFEGGDFGLITDIDEDGYVSYDIYELNAVAKGRMKKKILKEKVDV